MERFNLSADLCASNGVVFFYWPRNQTTVTDFASARQKQSDHAAGYVRILGIVATHMLHFAMWDMNNNATLCQQHFSAEFSTRRCYHVMATGYTDLINTAKHPPSSTHFIVDASYGVGSIALTNVLIYYDQNARI
jgi:hypothetical protein